MGRAIEQEKILNMGIRQAAKCHVCGCLYRLAVDLRVSPGADGVSGLGQQSGWTCPGGRASSSLGDPRSVVLNVGSVPEPQVSN